MRNQAYNFQVKFHQYSIQTPHEMLPDTVFTNHLEQVMSEIISRRPCIGVIITRISTIPFQATIGLELPLVLGEPIIH